ncbi:MAG: hypothetical protein A2W91_03965 [Bacteroidetes bacterium GWF2_38_335]|nr:MAG: hypothetical protein A2W91_03965 [Bacteroidetes bacterium GWF2_38_335]OFY79107.1 MAG: hypothetical protein A2281_03300 [Bacteroidetes bacterium RIFOXYA12_FULL_38_20]HBS88807.1 hypothetical protein [Bacteroidales bacterium]
MLSLKSYIIRYANLSITIWVFSFLTVGIIFNGCKEDEEVFPYPEISFVIENGFLHNDTLLLIGDTVKIGIIAKTSSDDELTHFNYSVTQDGIESSVDTGIWTNQFTYTKQIVKGVAENETWEFYVRDREGRKSQVITLTLTKNEASLYGNIRKIPSIIMGAQNNTTTGSFYSLFEETLFNLDAAFANQEKVDILYYFDLLTGEDNTISSPGANVDASVFPGASGLSNWTILNTTRYVFQDSVTIEEFDNCHNDSLILYNTFEFMTGKRKAKNLQPGHIYSFITNNDGKKGMFKVVNVTGAEEGIIEIEVKIQE